ncbi:MAG: hypothetical protein RLZZ440_1553, partial [Planctomycetota bacterium]
MAIDGRRSAGRRASPAGTAILLVAVAAAGCRPAVQVP